MILHFTKLTKGTGDFFLVLIGDKSWLQKRLPIDIAKKKQKKKKWIKARFCLIIYKTCRLNTARLLVPLIFFFLLLLFLFLCLFCFLDFFSLFSTFFPFQLHYSFFLSFASSSTSKKQKTHEFHLLFIFILVHFAYERLNWNKM